MAGGGSVKRRRIFRRGRHTDLLADMRCDIEQEMFYSSHRSGVYRRICINRWFADATIAFPITDRSLLCHRSKSRSLCEICRDWKTMVTSAPAHFESHICASICQWGRRGSEVLIEIDNRGAGCQMSLLERHWMWLRDRSTLTATVTG